MVMQDFPFTSRVASPLKDVRWVEAQQSGIFSCCFLTGEYYSEVVVTDLLVTDSTANLSA